MDHLPDSLIVFQRIIRRGWKRSVYQGQRAKHLQSYLDGFIFRFNRSRTRHAAFHTLFGFAVRTKLFTCDILVRPEACV